jgi:hypothetical protein
MPFKISSKNSTSVKDPESLFRDLRNRTVEGLMAQQADMLRLYMENVSKPDLALELPTGSGKTLVGLLIAEWRRRAKQERCVYLCPTKQLVHQVVEQAHEKYGIQAISFAGRKKHYTEKDKSSFLNCEAIGVATYSALFNTDPFFNDVGTIIFDDAHAAENYVSSFWSLEINRQNDPSLFPALWGLINKYLPEHDQLRYQSDDDNPVDSTLVNKLPTPYLIDVKGDLISLLDIHCTEGEHYFRWRVIRDHIHACHLYYTSHSFLIRPVIAPTQSFEPFAVAKQRIYMSATLGEGGDLERIFGREGISRIPAPTGWDKQGIGRRFFVFPMRIWDEADSITHALTWISKFKRCLILTPSDRVASQVRRELNDSFSKEKYHIFNAEEIEASKKKFTQTTKAVAVLANRYDGIDLIGDECRYLIVHGLPEATNLQERFFISRLGASVLFHVRIRTRVTQAVGRCTRSATDYALVVVIGEKMNNYFLKPENRSHLHPELQAEVEFGIEQSKVTREDDLSENIDIFISQNNDWKKADNHILETRDNLSQETMSSTAALRKIVASEVKYQNHLWNEHFEEALSSAKDVLAELSGAELRGYRALWGYLAGNAAYFASSTNKTLETVAKQYYSDAAVAANTLPWLKQLRSLFQEDESAMGNEVKIAENIEILESLLEEFGKSNSKKIEKYFSAIRSGLAAHDSKLFEEAQVKLGRLLGFYSDNSNDQGAPDPWWVFGNTGIVFEDYTGTGNNPVISKDKVLQASGHPNWLKDKHPNVSFTVVFCSRSHRLHPTAKPHVDNIYYINVEDFVKFSENVISTVRELWDSYPGAGNIQWRELASRKLVENKLSSDKVLDYFKQTLLSSLSAAD